MILITSKKKEFSIPEIGNIHNELNNFYIHNIFAYQNDSEEYQNILTRFSNLLNTLYQIIEDMKRYNNNNNNNNNNNFLFYDCKYNMTVKVSPYKESRK